MRFLRTNTAIRITVGPFLDKTDGVTPEVALTVTSCHLTLTVDDANVPTLVLDAAATASGGSNDMVHITNDNAGFYDLELTAANLNYLGRAMLAITDAATHCPVFHEFMILPAMVYDSLVLGTDVLQTDVTQLLGTAWLTPGTAGTPDVNTKLIGGSATPVTNIGVVFNTDFATNYDATNDKWQVLAKDHTGANLATATAVDDLPTNAELATSQAAADDATLAAIAALNNLSSAQAQTAAESALQTYHLDHLIQSADPGAIVANSSLWAALVSKSATPAYSSYVNTTDSLEALRDNTGTAGAGLTAADDAVITVLGSPAGVSLSADVAAVKTDTGNLVTRITSALFSGITSLASWLGALAGKTADAGTQTEIRATTAGAGYTITTDSLEAVRDRGDAAWITATGFSTLDAAGVRTAVGLASANLDTQLDALPTNSELTTALGTADDAVLAAIAALNNITAASVWAVGTRELTSGTNIVLAKGTGVTGFNDLSAAQVNAEADTALSDVGVTLARMGALTDWIDGGRLDLILDGIQGDVHGLAVRKNAALSNFPFKLVSDSDHSTPVTGATVTATRSIDGAAFAACANSATEVGAGMYKINLAAADLNGTVIVLRFAATGADTHEIAILTQNT